MRRCEQLGVCQSLPAPWTCAGCTMPGLRVVVRTAKEWGLPHAVPPVLRTPSGQHAPEQARRPGNDGSDQAGHSALVAYVWPGRREGVRPPDAGETPLSTDEVSLSYRGKVWLAGLAFCLLFWWAVIWSVIKLARWAGVF